MLITIPASRSGITLPNLHKIAIETGFIIRESPKMTAQGFIQTIISAVISGRASYNQLAHNLGKRTGDPMSRQGMEDRFEHDATVEFVSAVHGAILEAQFQHIEAPLKKSPIKRIVVEDSSGKSMPKSNADNFPAHGNHHGPTAGVKIDFAYDVINNSVTNHTLHGATEQDKTIGKEAVVTLQPRDLSLRDMGYFCLSEFTYIENLEAYWLTRLPLTVGVTLVNGKPLEKYLKHTKSNEVELTVNAGDDEQKQCRLVAIRADSKVTSDRRRKRRKDAKSKGKTASEKALIRDGWHIMLTNLSVDELSARDLADIYRIRWGVEIQFRAWKQSINLDKALNRKSKENHMRVLILGAMITHVLAMIAARIFASVIGLEKLSHEKLFDVLADHCEQANCLDDILSFTVDERHISRDKRFREIPFVKGLAALA